MADNNIENSPSKGLRLDINTSLVKEDVLTHARNATRFSTEGDLMFYQPEQGTREILTLPYPVIGSTRLPDGKWCLFLTDDVSSEIGVFDEATLKYTTSLNNSFLNFNRSNLITAVSKENADCTFSVYWADGRRNPDRVLNLSKTSSATYDSIRLQKLVSPPSITTKKAVGGVLKNGAYQVAIYYSINKERIGDLYGLTIPRPLFSNEGNNNALDIVLDNLDPNFREYQLVIIQTSLSTTTAKIAGVFPRESKFVHISNFDDPSYIPLDISNLTIVNQPWISSDKIDSNNQYLFRAGTETIAEVNYQQQASLIQSEYVAYQVPEDYYTYGDKVGHYRDEKYLYFIQLLHKIGTYSSAFVISGRMPNSDDLATVSSPDAYEYSLSTCTPGREYKRWEIENTAAPMTPTQDVLTDMCEGRIIGYGNMGYFASTETYPTNTIQFGADAGQPIRLHLFPDEEKCPRYAVIDGKNYVNILGVRFKNITKPLKADGTIDDNWVGYRILRADRHGNRTVISRGMLTNMRSYTEKQTINQEVLYSNYPYNDLRPDSYISNTQTVHKDGGESYFSPLTKTYDDKFTFYSPHSKVGRYALGEELKIESEEIATVTGSFTEVYKHPKERLLTQFAFWAAAIIGIAEAYVEAQGATSTEVTQWHESTNKASVTLTGGVEHSETSGSATKTAPKTALAAMVAKAKNAISNLVGAISSIISGNFGGFKDLVNLIADIAQTLITAGISGVLFTLTAMRHANVILDAIYNFTAYKQYALQYNSRAFFSSNIPSKRGNKRRWVTRFKYLENGLQTVNNQIINNFNKEESIYLELNSPISKPVTIDNSRQTLGDFNKNIGETVNATASAFYASSKRSIPNQYGRVENITKFISCHNAPLQFPTDSSIPSDVIFGGDCWINRYSVLKKHQFFSQSLDNSNEPDGVGFDYKLYRNIGYARYWIDSFKYDFSSILNKQFINQSQFSKTLTAKYNLDKLNEGGLNKMVVDGYFYTSANGVMDFFVESDYNLAFRERVQNNLFYSSQQSSLSEIFRSDRLKQEEIVKYDVSFSKMADQIYALQQLTDYDPAVYSSCIKYDRNRFIYSLPSYKEQKFDNWLYFLTGNQYPFPRSEFGNFMGMHRVDGERLLFLFDRSSPYITVGRNELQLSSQTITIGDGGLFAQPPRELMYTEQHYGNSQSGSAAISTQFGTFYVSERQGRLFSFSGALDEITRNNIQWWSKKYFPIKLIQRFPTFKDRDNIVKGVGYTMAFDSIYEIGYVSKKDYYPKKEVDASITYDAINNRFLYIDAPITLGDPAYFDDLSFTLSFSPSDKEFVSFHDWIPDWVLLSESHFFTVKGLKIFKHNDNCQDYCKHYNIQYPFEIEYVAANKFGVNTLSSIEYTLECYKYTADCKNKGHLLYENFDNLVVYNTEQSSGMLNLVKTPDNPYLEYLYPKINGNSQDILFTKQENRYRVNQLTDITASRPAAYHIIHTYPNGWKRAINPPSVNINKSVYEKKLFRHYDTKIWLAKQVPVSNMIFKLGITKEVNSER